MKLRINQRVLELAKAFNACIIFQNNILCPVHNPYVYRPYFDTNITSVNYMISYLSEYLITQLS